MDIQHKEEGARKTFACAVPIDLLRRMKIEAAVSGIPIRELVTQALEARIAKNERRAKRAAGR